MALEFLSDAPVEDAELVIKLDLEGLQTLLYTLQAALQARLEAVTLEGGEGSGTAGGEASNAFGRVGVQFVKPASDAAATSPASPCASATARS